MLASSSASLAVYGLVLGFSNSWLQAISSSIKLPVLFLATLAICLPTLYLFNLVFGAKLSMLQAVALIMTCITVTAVLSLAFAPISLFFLISAQSYSFFKLLNVAILVLTATVGLKFLTAGMRALNEQNEARARTSVAPPPVAPVSPAIPPVSAPPTDGAQQVTVEPSRELVTVPANGGAAAPATVAVPQPAPQPVGVPHPAQAPLHQFAPRPMPLPVRQVEPRQASMGLLYIWIALFAFVGTQLAWTLRPFFGSPGEPFAIFRKLEGTFYGDIFSTIGRLLGG
jgi:hypothetical protein